MRDRLELHRPAIQESASRAIRQEPNGPASARYRSRISAFRSADREPHGRALSLDGNRSPTGLAFAVAEGGTVILIKPCRPVAWRNLERDRRPVLLARPLDVRSQRED